jgi:hypothetical protein
MHQRWHLLLNMCCAMQSTRNNIFVTYQSEALNMNIEEIREYCISKPCVTEGFPFNDTALIFKVMRKIFSA